MCIFAPSHSKEVSDGYFYRWFLFVIPINADNRKTPIARWSHPYMLNRTRALDFCQGNRLTPRYISIRIYFPPNTQFTSLLSTYTIFELCHSALTRLTGYIFRADRSCLCIRQPVKITKVQIQSIEIGSLCKNRKR